jgi:hypothetical protein
MCVQLEDQKRDYSAQIEKLQQDRDDLNNRIKKLQEGKDFHTLYYNETILYFLHDETVNMNNMNTLYYNDTLIDFLHDESVNMNMNFNFCRPSSPMKGVIYVTI